MRTQHAHQPSRLGPALPQLRVATRGDGTEGA
jgi:hypothetical protein